MSEAPASMSPAVETGKDAEVVDRNRFAKRVYTSLDYFQALNQLTLYADFRDSATVRQADDCWNEIVGLLETVELKASSARPDSDVSRFNALPSGGSMSVDATIAHMVERASGLARLTNGAFDPASSPLVDLWGFSPRMYAARDGGRCADGSAMPYDRVWHDGCLPVPDPHYIESLRRLVDAAGIEVAGSDAAGWRLAKRTPAVELGGRAFQAQIDLGGIAKGYVVDEVARIMRGYGFEYGCYSCASSIALLKSGGKLAVRRNSFDFNTYVVDPDSAPQAPSNYLLLKTHDCFVSTSGGYGRFYEVDGVRYSHLIDPRTGYPVGATPGGQEGCRRVATVTLLGPEATAGDALTTALCVMGVDETVAFFNERLRDAGWDLVMVTDEPNGGHHLLTSLDPATYHVLKPGLGPVRRI